MYEFVKIKINWSKAPLYDWFFKPSNAEQTGEHWDKYVYPELLKSCSNRQTNYIDKFVSGLCKMTNQDTNNPDFSDIKKRRIDLFTENGGLLLAKGGQSIQFPTELYTIIEIIKSEILEYPEC